MGENTKIEWADHTINLWWGCAKVHSGCKNCYAESTSKRWGNDVWGEKNKRKRIRSAIKNLNKMQNIARKNGSPETVFIGSMMDIFEESKELTITVNGVPGNTGKLRDELLTKIWCGHWPDLIFLLLTKRPENISRMLPVMYHSHQPENVWFGTSISDRKTLEYHQRLLRSGMKNLFISMEPQIEMIDNYEFVGIGWIIQGGESGPNNRPFNIDWAYKMKQMAHDQNIPYFFKQIDKKKSIPNDLLIRQFPNFTP